MAPRGCLPHTAVANAGGSAAGSAACLPEPLRLPAVSRRHGRGGRAWGDRNTCAGVGSGAVRWSGGDRVG
eukprot:2896884-Prymnesium_polylepis.1